MDSVQILEAVIIALLTAGIIGMARWTRVVERRMTDVESKLELGSARFQHIENRFGNIEDKIADNREETGRRFDRLENKIDMLVEHIVEGK